jgi:hypothetical protein
MWKRTCLKIILDAGWAFSDAVWRRTRRPKNACALKRTARPPTRQLMPGKKNNKKLDDYRKAPHPSGTILSFSEG